MKIKKIWSLTVSMSIAVALTACSGNPVDEKNVVLKATASANKVSNKSVNNVASQAPNKKVITVASKVTVKKVPQVVKSKPLTRTQVIAKKQSIASIGQLKQAQAKVKYAKAQAEKKRLEKLKIEKRRILAHNAVQVASLPSTDLVSRERFVGSKPRIKARLATTRVKQPARRVQVTKATILPVLKRQNPRLRKVAYKRSDVKRSTIARIDPNNLFGHALSSAAIERTKQRVRYDGKYVKIAYPWGDVPKSIGVCTDVVIRSYRRMGIDLQQEVHKDISRDFYAYPNLVKWGLKRPDPNIDHRRVYNLQVFFKRHNAELPRSKNPRDYKAGDLVTWMVGPSFPHIGVVVNKPSKADPNRLMIAHNIGYGPQVEDILFRFPMTGHYRYTKKHHNVKPALVYAKSPSPSVLKQLSPAEILQASNILTGRVKARRLPTMSDLLVKNNKRAKSKEKIMLAHLDSRVFNILKGLSQ